MVKNQHKKYAQIANSDSMYNIIRYFTSFIRIGLDHLCMFIIFVNIISKIIFGWKSTKGDLTICIISKNDFVAIWLLGPKSITWFVYFCSNLVKRLGLWPSVVGQRRSSLVPNSQGNELTLAILFWNCFANPIRSFVSFLSRFRLKSCRDLFKIVSPMAAVVIPCP